MGHTIALLNLLIPRSNPNLLTINRGLVCCVVACLDVSVCYKSLLGVLLGLVSKSICNGLCAHARVINAVYDLCVVIYAWTTIEKWSKVRPVAMPCSWDTCSYTVQCSAGPSLILLEASYII
jgi:hypothetical protein